LKTHAEELRDQLRLKDSDKDPKYIGGFLDGLEAGLNFEEEFFDRLKPKEEEKTIGY
jgi:hypothetical protein